MLYRSSSAKGSKEDDDFLLLPDLNWDRSTLGSLHLLALVERRDLWSLRDLKKRHVNWLRHMKSTLAGVVVSLYGKQQGGSAGAGAGDGGGAEEDGQEHGLDADMLKFYVHYQPTYYHFHIHIVHVGLEAGATQAVGKAIGLDSIISQLESMQGGDDVGMADVDLSYTLGEASELWTEIFLPLKQGRLSA